MDTRNEIHKLLDEQPKPKVKPKKPPMSTDWQPRYLAAYQKWFVKQYPQATAAGGYIKLTFPDIRTGNGMNRFIENFLKWNGHRATRVSSAGRMVGKVFIRSTTRSGAADISSTINGKSCHWEGKAGKDKPRPEQLREQALERAAGGIYEFIHNPIELYFYYDKIINYDPLHNTSISHC